MRLTELQAWAVAVAVAALPLAGRAQPSAEIFDLAGRVHYGFYHGDVRAIEAAQAALDRLGDSFDAVYYRDFAALRRAQLGAVDRDAERRLQACAERDVAPGLEGTPAADAWVLVAACAFVAVDARRVEAALAAAREHDDEDPRIGLVEAWVLERDAAKHPERRDALFVKLTEVVAAFDAWVPAIDDPDWGHAEALTALGKSALARGEARMARDLVERALLLAPDYGAAVELRAALQDNRGGNRAL
jgi:tetratricopeptide (TPR) repeat protein